MKVFSVLTLKMRNRRVRSVLELSVLTVAFLAGAVPASAQFTYIDSTNPTGLPDLSQKREPICAAAAMANTLWNWSAFPPFNDPKRPLLFHTNWNNFATNWGNDSDGLVQAVADSTYGPRGLDGRRHSGPGGPPGVEGFINVKGLAYNRVNKPNGLSIEMITGYANIKYSALRTLVQNRVQNAVLYLDWYEADGTTALKDPDTDEPCKHAMTVTGLDHPNKIIALSNPWGDHAAAGDPNPPVSTNYYDTFTVDNAEIAANDRIQLLRGGQGNAVLVSDCDNGTHVAQSVRPEILDVIKQGGSPGVTATVLDNPTSQTLTYSVTNPDSSEAIYHVYLLLDPTRIDITQAYLAAGVWLSSQQPNWQVELLNPNAGPEAAFFAVTNVTDPQVAPEYKLSGWTSNAQGLHYWTNSAPVGLGGVVILGFDMPGVRSHVSWDDVYIVANQNRTHAWLGVTIGGRSVLGVPALSALGAGVLIGLLMVGAFLLMNKRDSCASVSER